MLADNVAALTFNNDMGDSLRDYTNELRVKLQRESAWKALNDHYFNPKATKRFIRGIAISSRAPNGHGDAYDARGLQAMVPNLLLWNHEYMHPLGRVVRVEAVGEQVRFDAEIANVTGPYWVDQVWQGIVSRAVTRISMKARNLAPYKQNVWTDWCVEEFSVVETGADRGARITRVWETPPALFLDGRPNRKVYWSEGLR